MVSATSPDDIRLRIRSDAHTGDRQWFHFRVAGARGVPLVMRIENAGKASYPAGWQGYRAVASEDRITWRRVDTEYDGAVLTIRCTPRTDVIYVASFAPYTLDRHADLLVRCASAPHVRTSVLGKTVEGRDLDLVSVSNGAPDRVCWIIARQHPGETMGAWFVEGLLERLLDASDPTVARLLERTAFYLVPNMNPDGSARGFIRGNAAGANLNRSWDDPSLERSPEVFLVRERMHDLGVSFCLDVHGDEALPYVFAVGADGVESLPGEILALRDRFAARLVEVNTDFQTQHGYPRTPKGRANLALCTSYVASAFGALTMTLEQPFKDAQNNPDPIAGWSPERSRRLGAASLEALAAVVDDLPVARSPRISGS